MTAREHLRKLPVAFYDTLPARESAVWGRKRGPRRYWHVREGVRVKKSEAAKEEREKAGKDSKLACSYRRYGAKS